MDSRVRASIYRLAMVLVSLLLDAALGLASAQNKLDAAYTATLWGLPVGQISWTVELSDNRFKAAARGAITGLLRIVADGRGDVAVHGAMSEGKPVPSLFSLNLIAGEVVGRRAHRLQRRQGARTRRGCGGESEPRPGAAH